MDRLLIVLGIALMLSFMPAQSGTDAAGEAAQPVFFSMLFPQLMPGEATPGEAVAL